MVDLTGADVAVADECWQAGRQNRAWELYITVRLLSSCMDASPSPAHSSPSCAPQTASPDQPPIRASYRPRQPAGAHHRD